MQDVYSEVRKRARAPGERLNWNCSDIGQNRLARLSASSQMVF